MFSVLRWFWLERTCFGAGTVRGWLGGVAGMLMSPLTVDLGVRPRSRELAVGESGPILLKSEVLQVMLVSLDMLFRGPPRCKPTCGADSGRDSRALEVGDERAEERGESLDATDLALRPPSLPPARDNTGNSLLEPRSAVRAERPFFQWVSPNRVGSA